MVVAYMFGLRFTDFVPSIYIVLFDGLGQSDYSIFSPNYGRWEREGLNKMLWFNLIKIFTWINKTKAADLLKLVLLEVFTCMIKQTWSQMLS